MMPDKVWNESLCFWLCPCTLKGDKISVGGGMGVQDSPFSGSELGRSSSMQIFPCYPLIMLKGSCREYNVALRLELARKEIRDDPNRAAELAAYFTHAKLQPVHQALSLRSAMFIFFKLKNFATTAIFCRRLLELNPAAKVLILPDPLHKSAFGP